ncbi:MAG: hypothetical protein IME96_03120 [Proteobacteria bacterium]|nr:hypothetical protein [Pseudomonadota bacterium]
MTYPSEVIADEWSDTHLSLALGYRTDKLNWNISAPQNQLSELSWNNLQNYQITGGGRTIFNNGIYMRGYLSYGWIVDGDTQDSDYRLDNSRTVETSRSNSKADGGRTLDALAGFGYPFTFKSEMLKIIPLLGYSSHRQNLTVRDGSTSIPSYFSLQGLDDTYKAEWTGVWIGVDLLYKVRESLTLVSSLEYHWANYKANRYFNQRADLNSISQDANGGGVVISISGDYALTEKMSIDIKLTYQDWSTDSGINKFFYTDGTTDITRLNEVNWDSQAVMVGIAYKL